MEAYQGGEELVDINENLKERESGFSVGWDQAMLSYGGDLEEETYTKIKTNFPDYQDNQLAYDAWTSVNDWSFGSSNAVRYERAVEDGTFKLDAQNNVILGDNGFRGVEVLFDMDAVKGALLAKKHGYTNETFNQTYSELTQSKSQDLAVRAEGTGTAGRIAGIIAGHVAQPETVQEVVTSPAKVMGQSVLGGMGKAFVAEGTVGAVGEVARERRIREHMERANLEYTLWDSTQQILLGAGLGGMFRAIGSGLVDSATKSKILKQIKNPHDKDIVNRFFRREEYKLTKNTQAHIALMQKAMDDINNNRPVDVSGVTDIDIKTKTDPNIEEVSLRDELTLRDEANGYPEQVQKFEDDYAKAEIKIDEEPNGAVKAVDDIDEYDGMATKEEGDELLKEMSEVDPEIKAELDAIDRAMKIEDLSPKDKRSIAAKTRIEKKREEAERMFGADEDAINEYMKVGKKSKAIQEVQYDEEAIKYMDEEYIPLDAEGKSVFTFGGDPIGGALAGGTFGGTEALYEDMVENKDLTVEDYLGRIAAGMAVGAGLGKRYGGKGGTKMFVGARPDEPGAFSSIYDKGVRKWIDDAPAQVKKTSGVGFMSQVLDHPELYAQYPELKRIKIEFKDMGKGKLGSFKPESNKIVLNSNLSEDKIKSVLLHETQHGVQSIEKWSSGGSLKDFVGEDGTITKEAYEQYRALAGEQEARATQAALEYPELTPYEALKKKEGELPEPIVKMDKATKAESVEVKSLKTLEAENKSTLPKIPTEKVFKNKVEIVPKELRQKIDDIINKDEVDKLPIEEISIDDIIPTQKNITTTNLKKVKGIKDAEDEIIAVEDDGKYYVIDGHHRISNDILDGEKSVAMSVLSASLVFTTGAINGTRKEKNKKEVK